MNNIERLRDLGQSVWSDYLRRGMLTSGELQRLIDGGITGVTSNPTIFEKAIAGSADYDEALLELVRARRTAMEIYETLAIEDIRGAADLLRPVYQSTGGADGFASLECNPLLAYDTDGTIKEAKRLFAALDRPNVLIKVPATPEGIPAIRDLTGQGININITLIFSLETYRQVREAYVRGLEILQQSGGDIGKVASVASFFLSRVDTLVDSQIEPMVKPDRAELKGLPGKAAIANAKLAYQAFKETFSGDRFQALRSRGARVQRPLWASTGAKNPAYKDLMYVEPLVGPQTVNTMPLATITALLDHGRVEPSIERDIEESRQTLKALAEAGIDMEKVARKLLEDGVRLFADSFGKLVANIEEKKTRLAARERSHPDDSLGDSLIDVKNTGDDLQEKDVVSRIWKQDHTVWKQDPREISDRLGWLSVTEAMTEQLPHLLRFAREIREAGYHNVVLLGMGGSSLGPEVLRQTFGKIGGFPRLVVLDSTIPATVRQVAASLDLKRTVFLVSSKSGATIETMSLYYYFRSLADKVLSQKRSGRNFVAITDPGTPLAELAGSKGFLKTFLNPPDIGGRYSVLSYFGLVPAALAGIDVATLLDRADRMREGCAGCVQSRENQGARLGAIMGALATRGRDKLTIICSPSIKSFGLWAEQLVAESTGKEGRGIIPVTGEPLLDATSYGNDRLFVYLRLEGDRNSSTDKAIERLKAAGQPVVFLKLQDIYDLGAEFFRWEYATAVAGAILGINPFDQPNVQESKDVTARILHHYMISGHLMQTEEAFSLGALLAKVMPGSYLAIQSYLHETSEVEKALTEMRKWLMQYYRIATTAGYGPRYLHSTGQLHKGGQANGLFLQLAEDPGAGVDIPGKPYTMGVLTEAEAVGDFQALQSRGRPVIRINLGEHSAEEIQKLMKLPV
ncbi:MAG: bifunctional transaldolase/phosoglucose isomerase [Chloroflexi bacterium]|nr:bifunctional transaldolase/phosoglucose isomerase [Chloroflexota bacterium]